MKEKLRFLGLDVHAQGPLLGWQVAASFPSPSHLRHHSDVGTFRRLCDAAAGPEGDGEVRALFADPGAYDSWATGWRRRLEDEPVSGQARAAMMRTASPAFIPRNHMVEAALDAAVERQDFRPFEELLDVMSRPYEDRPELERYATPARPEKSVSRTFCGT